MTSINCSLTIVNIRHKTLNRELMVSFQEVSVVSPNIGEISDRR
jgi:hypothetical protein